MLNIMSDDLEDLHKKFKNYQYPTARDPNRTLPSFPKVISNKLLWDHLSKLGFIDRSKPIEKPSSTGFKTASNMSTSDITSRSLRVFSNWTAYSSRRAYGKLSLTEHRMNMERFVSFFAEGGLSVENLPDALNVLPTHWEKITLGELANLGDGFEMLEVVAAVLCLQDGVVRTKVRSLRDSVAMLRKNKPLFEFIIRMFLPRHEGMVSTEMDTERNIGAIIMPFFDISSNPSFFCHSNQPINVPPVMGFGSTVPRADLLTSVGLDQHTSIRVGIFIGEAKRPELKESTYLKIQSTPASSSLSVPEIQPSARPNFAQALNQTFLASLPILSLIALAATNGNKFSPNKPPPLPKHGFVFGLRYSAELILVDMMFPSWEVKTADAPDAPDAPSSGWVYNTVELGKFLLPEMFGGGRLSPGAFRFMNFMARVLEHNNELFEELSAASFHGIVGEAFRVWRHPVIDERQWLENLLQLDPAYDEILRHEEVTTIQEEYRRRREEKEEKQEKKKREKNKGKEKGKGEGNIHALEGRMGELALGD